MALALVVAQPVFAQTAGDQMSRTEFLAFGVALVRDDRAQDAANVADSLLASRPNDASALILRTEAAIKLGNYANAAKFAGRAYRDANSNNQKFGAARLAALAHSQLEQDTRAQLWLRRAREFAPNRQTAVEVAKDYQFLRNRNPWSTNLRFGVTPSSNINNGSTRESVTLFGLPFEFELDGEARALSGLQISGGVDLRYRLLRAQDFETQVMADLDFRTYTMSSAAQEQAPDARGRDFSDGTFSLGINHRQILAEGQRPTDFTLRAGQVWYAAIPYSQFVEASVSHTWEFGPKDGLTVSLSHQNRKVLDDDDPTYSQIAGLSARWFHSFENKDRLSLGVTLSKSRSENIDSDYKSVGYRASYDIAKPINGMRLGFGINADTRNFEASSYAPGPREDNAIGVDMSVNFTNLEFYGFQPVVKLSARRNESTVDLFDRDYTSIGLDLRSSF